MDEKVDRVEATVDRLGQDVLMSAERLAARVAVLSARVGALAPLPMDGFPPPDEPTGEIRGLVERVQALEEGFELLEGVSVVSVASEVGGTVQEVVVAGCRLGVLETDLRARLAEHSGLRSLCGRPEDDVEVLAEAPPQRPLAKVTELNRRIEAVRDPVHEREPGSPSPWLELQHLASAPTSTSG
jgi:hypothetical protein